MNTLYHEICFLYICTYMYIYIYVLTTRKWRRLEMTLGYGIQFETNDNFTYRQQSAPSFFSREAISIDYYLPVRMPVRYHS